MPLEKLVFISILNNQITSLLGIQNEIKVYRSKGLLTHLINRKHFIAAKYIDFIPDILADPDYIGGGKEKIEFVKCFKNSILLSIKLDNTKGIMYVSTMFEVKQSKIDSYCKKGRLIKLDKNQNSL
ncbi:MAG: hypothetical protein IK102_03080 [Treponema sp.]|nr:hypothetical protein [Treponema sp.]